MSLVLEKIRLVRGGHVLFKEVSYTLPKGTFTLLQGKNGQGKTSLLEAVMGLFPLASGTVLWEGRALCPEDFRAVMTEDGLKEALSVKDHLQLWQTLYGEPWPKAHLLHSLCPLYDKPVERLSAGQRQRLNLARLFFGSRSPLWFLDEPLTHLDTSTKEVVLTACEHHQSQGGILVMASHETPSKPLNLQILNLVSPEAFSQNTLRQELEDVAFFA